MNFHRENCQKPKPSTSHKIIGHRVSAEFDLAAKTMPMTIYTNADLSSKPGEA
ncbi:predicted protein [Sclerotinia sclerotiorum 1980 UF-70]|uniref:Alpha-carbonic anhydrase domain-containing protein n=1 Tax=Sclerotinia sclerotiorum (strain ATCC 18683 / 1980 / Ss-1) TaxID=665079 RepID=A7EMX2_SCLS1|nr:predicted protein [Sclerotinia sclerotiorum 1980 UF-70]EDO04188.1 predicted protein [Sclerotinia sclerotiorum 1980 UF-70]